MEKSTAAETRIKRPVAWYDAFAGVFLVGIERQLNLRRESLDDFV